MSVSRDLRAISTGDNLPTTSYTPDNVQLFFYNAMLWNAHRIHYDLPYATEVEGYKGLVIAGPMLGDWLGQVADNWVGDDGIVEQLEYSNRQASFIGETLTAGGTITAIDVPNRRVSCDLHVKNEVGEIITPGKAIVRFF